MKISAARIIALAVIAVVIIGLAYLKYATGPEPLSVPKGAGAGALIMEPRLIAIVVPAVLTVTSLLWLAHRARRRELIAGPAGRALIRSALPVLLGIGGWCLAALVTMSAALRTPVDDELLVIFSVALPIGLGVYLAWTSARLPARLRSTGLTIAVGGSLVGAWLGFNVTGGVLHIPTAIAGAAAAANLALIVLDMIQDRTVRLRSER